MCWICWQQMNLKWIFIWINKNVCKKKKLQLFNIYLLLSPEQPGFIVCKIRLLQSNPRWKNWLSKMGYGRSFMLIWLTCPSRPIFTGLCSFHGLERWAVFVKGNSRLQVERKTSIAHNCKQLHKKKLILKLLFHGFYLQIQSILKTPPSILAFMPAGRTQCMGEPPWWDSDESRAKPKIQTHILMCTNINPHKICTNHS